MGTAANVLVGATGTVKAAATGTAFPTTASAAPNVLFLDRGYVSEDGVTQSIGTDTTDIKEWSGSTVRTVRTSHTLTYHLTLIETNPNSVSDYYGAANFDDPTNLAKIKATMSTRQAWLIDVIDGTNKIRIEIPDGEVTERGDIIYKNDEAIGYEMTITAYPDSTDTKAYVYMLVNAIS